MSRPNLWHDTGWQPHNGRSCPVPPDCIVRFQFACGHVSSKEYPAHQFRWSKLGEPFDIVSYLIVERGAE